MDKAVCQSWFEGKRFYVEHDGLPAREILGDAAYGQKGHQAGENLPCRAVKELGQMALTLVIRLDTQVCAAGKPELPPFSVAQPAFVLIPPSGKKCTASMPKSG